MTEADYTKWLGIARRFSRRVEEADDLLHDALLIATEQGRMDLTLGENRKWLTGVIRNLAAMTARTAIRRRAREAHVSITPSGEESPYIDAPSHSSFLSRLSPSIRRLALLILHQMPRHEIEHVLGVTPAAYRQRLAVLRRALHGVAADERARYVLSLNHQRHAAVKDVALGLLRQALVQQLQRLDGVGTHDPDGHPLLLHR